MSSHPTIGVKIDQKKGETSPHLAISPLEKVVSLMMHQPGHADHEVRIEQDQFVVGRQAHNDLVLADLAFMSGHHFAIQLTSEGWVVCDLGSRNGTRLNNRGLTPYEQVPIHSGDVLRIGEHRSGSSVGFTFFNSTEPHSPKDGYGTGLFATDLFQIQSLTIGRATDCDIVLESPTVAAVHAIVRRTSNRRYKLQVCHEENPVWLNDSPVLQADLCTGDMIQIGTHLLTFDGRQLTRFASQGFRLDVVGVHKDVKTKNGKLRILDDINMTVMPREFVALVGGSGAGKSTLLDALNGFRPAQGQVLVNGQDLYANYDRFRQQIGYVPQHDILPTALQVEDALRYAAKLRLPADLSREERESCITHALDTVEMNSEQIRKTRIDRLSGGQRKRVSIAAELIADPKLFFLDEPSSGLDPGLEKKLMYTLRKMADEGRTIVLITHATANIVQVDHVGLLSKGQLVFFGPPKEAQKFFHVEEFADIYDKIGRNGAKWHKRFTQDKPEAYQAYVVNRLQSRAVRQVSGHDRPRHIDPLQGMRQLGVFSHRMFQLTLSDPIAFFVALLVMPFVGILQGLAAETYEFVGDPAILNDATKAAEVLTRNYLPAVSAQIFGLGCRFWPSWSVPLAVLRNF